MMVFLLLMNCFRKTSYAKVLSTYSDIKPKTEMAQSMEKGMQEGQSITQIQPNFIDSCGHEGWACKFNSVLTKHN